MHRQLPHLGNPGTGGIASDLTAGLPYGEYLKTYMRGLAERLRRVRVCCGDWSRICGPSPTVKHGITGVFLDPPYGADADRHEGLYCADDLDVAAKVREWAVEWGKDPRMRIALCGYSEEHSMPDDWECIHWKAAGGYGSQGNGKGRDNCSREVIWFSPHCLRNDLFARTEAMREECLDYQVRDKGPDKVGALTGEVDALVELDLLKKRTS